MSAQQRWPASCLAATRIAATLVAATLMAGLAGEALAKGLDKTGCQPIRMARGSDTIEVGGKLTSDRRRQCFRFGARKGQKMTWSVTGPSTKQLVGYPNGDTDGPMMEETLVLPQSGEYTFTVVANTMAENAIGKFRLRLTIR